MANSGAAAGRRERHRVREDDASLLTRLLDDAVRAHDGVDVLASVARLREAATSYAASPSERRLRRCDAVLDELDADVSLPVARAFTVECHLRGVAEERSRIRELRAGGRGTPPALGRDVRVTEVLTAHPTEARRRSVLEHLWRIGDLLDGLDDPRAGGRGRADLLRRLDDEVEGLWLTDPVRAGSPTPLDEVRAMTALFDRTIFSLVPRVVRSTGGRASFRWATWVGGDRDGNPHVTAEITRETAAMGREHVLLAYERVARTIARSLSVGASDCRRHARSAAACALSRPRSPLVRKSSSAPCPMRRIAGRSC
jgi:phosphoenolpyruvate carboxylase